MAPVAADVSVDGSESSETVEALRVIAEPMRFRIVQLLAGEQLCVCHLQEALDAKQALVSHHLKVLRDAGLVRTEACGRFTYYRLAPDAFDGVRAAVSTLAESSNGDRPRRPC